MLTNLQSREGVAYLDPAVVGLETSPSERCPPGAAAVHHAARFDWLYDNPTLSDVELRLGDDSDGSKEVFHAHKAVLAVHSPTYRMMFEKEWLENDQQSIDMNYSKKTCRAVLRHIYCCEHSIEADNALEVYDAAVFYGLNYLRDAAVRYLKSRISSQNVAELLRAAVMYNDKPLKDHCVAFVRQANAMHDLLYSEELFAIPKEVLLILVEEGVIDSDMNILTRLHAWAQRQHCGYDGEADLSPAEKTQQALQPFLQFINFTVMTPAELEAIEEAQLVPVSVLYAAFKQKVLGVGGQPAVRRGAIHLRWDDRCVENVVTGQKGENHLRKKKEGWAAVVALNKFSKGRHYWVYTVHDLKVKHDSFVGVTQCRSPAQENPKNSQDKALIVYEPCCNTVLAHGGVATRHSDAEQILQGPWTEIGLAVDFDTEQVSFYHHGTKTLLWTVHQSPLPSPMYPYVAIFSPFNGGVTLGDTTTFLHDGPSFQGQCGSCGMTSPSKAAGAAPSRAGF